MNTPSVFSNIVPIETLIVDEASQIELGDFVPVLCNNAETIKKLVFVGDDKQRESPCESPASSHVSPSGSVRPGRCHGPPERIRDRHSEQARRVPQHSM